MAPSAPQPQDPRPADLASSPASAATSLLSAQDLPDFGALRPEDLERTLRGLLARLRQVHDRCFRGPRPDAPTWDNVVAPEMMCNDAVQRIWSLVDFLCVVLDQPGLRAMQQSLQPELGRMWSELGGDPGRLARYLALRDSPGFAALPAARRRIVDLALSELRRGGATLDPAARARMGAIEQRLLELGTAFTDKAYGSHEIFRLAVGPQQLRGIPEVSLAAALEQAAEQQACGHGLPLGTTHVFTLRPFSCDAVLTHGEDRTLRRQLYQGYVTRASEFDLPRLDNSAHMAEILALRFEFARIAGYDSYAEYALDATMAGGPGRVQRFLREIAQRALPRAERELRDLREFAARHLGLPELQAWDVIFACQQMKQAQADASPRPGALVQVVDEPDATQAMFELARRLFGLHMVEQSPTRAWHPDVRLWRVEAADASLVGHLYADLYAREGKRGEVCAAPLRNRCRGPDGSAHLPAVALLCDFDRLGGAGPARLDAGEVGMLFHEFGHCLHALLTQVDEPWVAGLAWLETDAVEWPSQFVEQFAAKLELPGLRPGTGEAGPGEPLAAYLLLHEVRAAMFDLTIHHELREFTPRAINEAAARIEREFNPVPAPDFSRHYHTLHHVFDAPYPSTLYSYLWGEMLAAELHEDFEQHAGREAAWGARLREQILGVGSSRDTIESFRAFLGRDPTIDALLRKRRIGGTA